MTGRKSIGWGQRAAGDAAPGTRPRGALGFVRIPAPGPGERFGWRFGRGDRLALEFDPDSGFGGRFDDRIVFRIGGGEVSLLGPCDAASLRSVTARLPDGRILTLDSLVSDDETIDRIAETLSGERDDAGGAPPA